jgi:hypothetical protein
MSNKTIGIVLIVVGVLLVALAFLAHQLGLSATATFGLKKYLSLGVGAVALLGGLYMAFIFKKKS